MIDEPNIFDPALNYTQPQNQPFGARIPEFAIRQLVGSVFKKVRDTVDHPDGILDELFAMHGREALRQIKGFFREHPNLPVSVNWPQQGSMLPLVCVINMGEEEDESFRFLGDQSGLERRGQAGAKQTIRAQKAVGMAYQLDVVVGTQDPNLTLFLHYVVKHAVFVNKGPLAEFFDVHNVVIGGRDLSLDPAIFPSLGYYKGVSLKFMTVFDVNSAPQSSVLVGVGLLVDALKDGEAALSEVPEDR